MAIRMTGLISGMDTEGMVKELVQASSTKVDNIKKDKQLLEWKKEAWQDLNTKIYNFYKTELSAFKTNGSYRSKKATVNDETKASIKATSSASNGTHTVSVKQLASSAYLTGANIKAAGGTYDTFVGASATTNFESMTDKDGNSLNLKGQSITIGNGSESIEFVLGGEGDNGVANLSELNKKLSETEGFKGLEAGFVDGQITFKNTSASKDEDGNETGTVFTVDSAALGVTGELNYKADEATGAVTSLSGVSGMGYIKEFTSADISKSTKLADLGIAVGTAFSINGKEFVVDDKTTMEGFAAGLSKLGVSASFDATQGRFYINASGTGAANDFTLTSTDENALKVLGLDAASATKIDAQDAIIDYNGVEYKNASNTFSINGLNITAKGVTGTYDKVTGTFTGDTPLNISVTQDTDTMYDTVKNFVKKYNELVDEMNKLYDEKKTDYEPLTEEEKSQLSEKQIEQWEEKAKQGLLRRDSTINTLLSKMRNILNKGVKVTNEDGTTSTYTLASLGIVTGEYTEKGKLHILGDEDDAAYASQPNKLKEMLETKPEVFAQVLGGNLDNQGIGFQLYDSLSDAMKGNANRSALTFYEDKAIDSEIDDKDDEIDKWAEKLQELEDKYYDQFAAMESAMAKLQSQQSYISSLMGM